VSHRPPLHPALAQTLRSPDLAVWSAASTLCARGDAAGLLELRCQESGVSTRHANEAMIAMGNEAIFTRVFGVAAS
jgi:hypothetical protein